MGHPTAVLTHQLASAYKNSEKLQSSFQNSDLTLFALVRMLKGRKLRGLLSEDFGARVAYIP